MGFEEVPSTGTGVTSRAMTARPCGATKKGKEDALFEDPEEVVSEELGCGCQYRHGDAPVSVYP